MPESILGSSLGALLGYGAVIGSLAGGTLLALVAIGSRLRHRATTVRASLHDPTH